MEFINSIQLLILTLIIGLLFFQMVAKKKGMFIEVKYSDKQRLAIALGIAAILLIWGLLTEQYFMFVIAIVTSITCYQRKMWYKLK